MFNSFIVFSLLPFDAKCWKSFHAHAACTLMSNLCCRCRGTRHHPRGGRWRRLLPLWLGVHASGSTTQWTRPARSVCGVVITAPRFRVANGGKDVIKLLLTHHSHIPQRLTFQHIISKVASFLPFITWIILTQTTDIRTQGGRLDAGSV